MVHEGSLAYSNWKCRWYAFCSKLKPFWVCSSFFNLLLIFGILIGLVGLYMVVVERQIQNREKMLAESLRAAEAEGNNTWSSIPFLKHANYDECFRVYQLKAWIHGGVLWEGDLINEHVLILNLESYENGVFLL